MNKTQIVIWNKTNIYIKGYVGFYCQTQVNNCESNPCQNNGLCIFDNTNSLGFECKCIPPYTGTYCSLMIDPCSSQPCGLNGYCASSTQNPQVYVCNCKPGFTGSKYTTIKQPFVVLYQSIKSRMMLLN